MEGRDVVSALEVTGVLGRAEGRVYRGAPREGGVDSR